MRYVEILPVIIGLAATGCLLDDGVVGRDTADGGPGSAPDSAVDGRPVQQGDAGSPGRDAAARTDSAMPGSDGGTPSPEAAPPGDATGTDTSPPSQDSSPGTTGAAHPPPGTSLCGQGTFTQAESLAACSSAATAQVCSDYNSFAPDGSTQPVIVPSQCDGATITGGSWQVWCSAAFGVYFYAEWDGPLATGTVGNCTNGGEFLTPTEGWLGVYNNITTSNVNTGPGPIEPKLLPAGAEGIFNASQSGITLAAHAIVVEQTIGADALANWDFGVDTALHGSAYAFYAGECNGAHPVVLGGVALTWNGGM